jgi:hypothetical protein
VKDYWKLKAMALEVELRIKELQAAATEVMERKKTLFTAAGLDGEQEYKFDDTKERITARTPDS